MKSKNTLFFSLVFLSLIFFLNKPVFSATEGNINNNKYGIHLAQPSDEDIIRARELVNSNGGEWGYITLVIHEDDKNIDKWQGIFEKLRENRLIPIIRLATKSNGRNWERPESQDAKEWSSFLNSLRWVIKNRYIILFNEPNHATEWGGEVDSKNFANVTFEIAKTLKETNPSFFIMKGGLDLSAPSQRPKYEDAGIFLEEVINEIGVDNYNKVFDGLSSHSYPNPAFSSSPTQSGRKSVRGYEWEIDKLKSLGVKSLPVFITETGWDGDAISRLRVADNFSYAYRNVWLPDKRVYAVTPFILNYQGEPFLKFSWLKKDTNEPYPEYFAVKNLPKNKGRPEIEEQGEILFDLDKELVENSMFHLQVELKNFGQGIWSEENEYQLIISTNPEENLEYISSDIGIIRPNESRVVDFYIKTGSPKIFQKFNIFLVRSNEVVLSSRDYNLEIVSLPKLDFKVSLFPMTTTNNKIFEIQIFDNNQQMVFRKKDLTVNDGNGVVEQVENIALNTKYRVVLLKKGYLPRQTFVTFKKEGNVTIFEPMLPLDPSGDGTLNLKDLFAIFP